MMRVSGWIAGLGGLTVAVAAPLAAQDAREPGFIADVPEEALDELPGPTIFDGDFMTIGAGVGLVPSYSGSDDYVLFPLPLVQGSIGGFDLDPRPAGLAVDFLPDSAEGPNFSLGVVARLNRDRVNRIEDEVVEAYGELDTALEVGPTAGVSFPKLLNPFDSLSFNVDVAWDVLGAHNGMTISPSVSYFTPLSRAAAVSLSVSTEYIDDDYARYYYSVPAADPLAAGQVLPVFDAEGGFEDIGVNLLVGYDLNGDVTDGGLALVGIGGYSRLLGDAKNTPFTSLRGDADQWIVAVGIGYTFGL